MIELFTWIDKNNNVTNKNRLYREAGGRVSGEKLRTLSCIHFNKYCLKEWRMYIYIFYKFISMNITTRRSESKPIIDLPKY